MYQTMVADRESEDGGQSYEHILPTCLWFHNSPAAHRCIVGPVGSGKTTAASWELCYYLPHYIKEEYGIHSTRWVVVRNTYKELVDTTQRTLFEWFPNGDEHKQENTYDLSWPGGIDVEILFRSCDNPKDIKKFKSLEITGFWIDEAIEVSNEVRKMLKNRIGRYPRKSPCRFGIETTNPPDVEHPIYHQYEWQFNAPTEPGPILPPGPPSARGPLKDHEGFWQPPYENVANLRPGYYEDLKDDYADSPDWIEMYILNRPGVLIRGKTVYHNYRREYHEASEPIVYSGGPLYVGWDNTGTTPAAVVVQVPSPRRAQVLAEYWSDRMGIVDFTNWVSSEIRQRWPGCKEISHYGDPAGEAAISQKRGGFTSNAQLMRDAGVPVLPSNNNFQARVESVEQMLGRIDGVLIDPSCTRLINGFLGGYCYPENQSIQGEYLPNVLKNRYSHPHDALQYVFVQLFKPVEKRPDARSKLPEWVYQQEEERRKQPYDPLTYGMEDERLNRRR